jgi:anti-sigma B factor antagonist
MQPMHLQIQQLPHATVVRLDGAVDAHSYSSLAAVLQNLLTRPLPRVILDCAPVTYVGTAEIKSLLDFAHRARARGGDIKLAGLAPTIEQVATLIANGDPLECFPGIAEALTGFHLTSAYGA